MTMADPNTIVLDGAGEGDTEAAPERTDPTAIRVDTRLGCLELKCDMGQAPLQVADA